MQVKAPSTEAGVRLRDEAITILELANPRLRVDAPAWPGGSATALDLLTDAMANDALATDVLKVLALATKSLNPATRVLSQSVLAQVAAQFAYYQEDFLDADTEDRFWSGRMGKDN